MTEGISRLLKRLREIEAELDQALAAHRASMRASMNEGAAFFTREVLDRQRHYRRGLAAFLARAPILFILTAPVIYSLLIPIALLDAFLFVYQRVCFSVYGIPRVQRHEYIAWDRHHLAYLNFIEKLNCAYCGYATGVIAYAREIGSRTEAYWCPIKHAEAVKPPHASYPDFLEFGDAEGFRTRQDARGSKQE